MADDLVLRVYHATRGLPAEERFGLQAQLRRAAVSAASNIVEGCARRSTREYQNLVNISFGSAAEAPYLLRVAYRLRMLSQEDFDHLDALYDRLLRATQKLIASLDRE